MEKIVFIIGITFLGMCLGSFTTLLIHRLHFDEPGILWGRSQCPQCKKKLSAKNLFPVFSWIFQKGRCTHCHEKISFLYPLIEITFGLSFFLFVQKFYSSETLLPLLIFVFIALILFFYDALYLEVDQRIIYPALLGAVIWMFFRSDPWTAYLWGGAVGYAFYAAQYYLSGKKWVGDGDMQLGLFMGLLLGWQDLLLGLFIAYILGFFVAVPLLLSGKAHSKTMLPMGAFLMPALLIMLYSGDFIRSVYISFIGF